MISSVDLSEEIVGRAEEIKKIEEVIERLQAKEVSRKDSKTMMVLMGPQGMGKSLLIDFSTALARDKGHTVLTSKGSPVNSSSILHIWRPIVMDLFGLGLIFSKPKSDWPNEEKLVELLESQLDSTSVHYVPLFSHVLPISIEDNELTRSIVGKKRLQLLSTQICNIIYSRARESPLMIVLEDLQYFDSVSLDLLLELASNVRPFVLVLSSRPFVDQVPEQVEKLMNVHNLQLVQLSSLSVKDCEKLVIRRLQLRVGSLPSELMRILPQAQGNPLYTQEMAFGLLECGAISVSDDASALSINQPLDHDIELSTTIHAVIRSRIDRLSATSQMVLKIGLFFLFILLSSPLSFFDQLSSSSSS